jgi:hypothetical protein
MALLAVQAGWHHANFVLGDESPAPVPIKEAWGLRPAWDFLQARCNENLVLSIGWMLAASAEP